jgi:hypothetical protein
MNKLGTTLKASEVKADDYAAIYYVGGHGVGETSPTIPNFSACRARSGKRAASFLPFATASWAFRTSSCPTARTRLQERIGVRHGRLGS